MPGVYFIPPPNGSIELVTEQIDRLNDLADDMLAQVDQALGQLQYSYVNTAQLDPRFFQSGVDEFPMTDLDMDLSDLMGDPPSADAAFNLNPAILSALSEPPPTFVAPAMPAMPTMPDEPADPGEPSAIPTPSRPVLADPEAPSLDLDSPLPTFEDFVAGIPVPVPRQIDLPAVPVLSLSALTFDEVPPTFDIEEPDAALFQFTPGTHTPLYQTELEATIKRILTGGSGLPPGVAEAMFERAREREVELADRDVDQVSNTMAAKGHKYPPGALNRRIDRFRRDASAKISQLNRDDYIARLTEEIKLVNDIVGRALAAEETALNAFIQGERLRFDAAQMQLNFALQIFNAKITRINAEVNLYGIKAQVFRDRLAAEETKIRLYQAELEGKRLIGELNKQDIEIYNARLNALNTNAEIFRTRMQAYAEQFRILDARVALFRAQLEKNQSIANIYESDVRAMGTLVEAQKGRDERFRVKAQIFSEKVNARSKEFDALLAGFQAQFKVGEFQRDTYLANQERAKSMIQAEATRVDALAKSYQAVASQVSAKADAAKARYTLMLSIAQAKIEQVTAAVNAMLKNGEINIQSALQAQNFSLRSKETAATALAQLAAGFTAAANVSASMSDSRSFGYNFSVSAEQE